MKRILLPALVLLMAFALIFVLVSCNNDDEASGQGQAERSFTFVVVHNNGEQKSFDITSSKKYVGEALVDQGLIAGEDGPYGLYVKTVDGETLDYDKDGKYWAFYVNDAYSMSGVDKTEITDDAKYSFKAE